MIYDFKIKEIGGNEISMIFQEPMTTKVKYCLL